MSVPNLEGQICITLTGEPGRECNVAIANSRPLGLASQLAGMEPEPALRRVALLFSACRIAQSVAGCQAVEDAYGMECAPEHMQARALLLAAETVLEHAQNMLLRWPVLLGKPASYIHAVRQLRASLSDLWRDVYPQSDWMRPGGGLLRPDHTAIAARVAAAHEALEAADLASLVVTDNLAAWLISARGPAADLLRRIDQEDWNSYGAGNVAGLEDVDHAVLSASLANDEPRSFIAQPCWQGTPRWTGPLARQKTEPLLRAAIEHHGCGLTAHFLAHCVETQRTFEFMHALSQQLKSAPGVSRTPCDGHGLGVVQAARGMLAHRVEIAGGLLHRYQILAPTEWNFHPDGVVVSALQHCCAAEPLPANLFVAALDPCVPWQIELKYIQNERV